MTSGLVQLQSRLGRGKSAIGLHMDTYSVHAAQVVNYKGQATLIRSAVEKISLKEGVGADSAISSALKAVLSGFSLGHATIICTFHDPQVFVRKITTPIMPLEELGSAVRLALKNAFPFSLDEAVLDFRLVNKFSYQGKERYNVLVAAAPSKIIKRIQDLFLTGHIKLASCIPAALALENLIGKSRLKIEETLAVIVLGPTVTELAIYRNSHLEFSRKLSIVVEDVTKSMTGAFFSDTGKTELTFEQAQAIEKEYGIPKPDETIPIAAKITSQQILMLIGPKIEALATEINRSMDYYREELQGGKVDRVLLVGAASRLKRLDEFLGGHLGLEVTYGNPLEAIGLLDPSLMDTDDAACKQALAIGAALQAGQGINLLSGQLGKKDKSKIQPVAIKALVIAIIVGIALVFTFLNNQIQAKTRQVEACDQKLAPRLTEIRDILAVRQLSEGRPSWGEILKVLSCLPRHIYLNELDLSNDQLRIQGVVSIKGDSQATLDRFILSLQENFLKDARLKSLQKVKDEADQFEFEIVASVKTVK